MLPAFFYNLFFFVVLNIKNGILAGWNHASKTFERTEKSDKKILTILYQVLFFFLFLYSNIYIEVDNELTIGLFDFKY